MFLDKEVWFLLVCFVCLWLLICVLMFILIRIGVIRVLGYMEMVIMIMDMLFILIWKMVLVRFCILVGIIWKWCGRLLIVMVWIFLWMECINNVSVFIMVNVFLMKWWMVWKIDFVMLIFNKNIMYYYLVWYFIYWWWLNCIFLIDFFFFKKKEEFLMNLCRKNEWNMLYIFIYCGVFFFFFLMVV